MRRNWEAVVTNVTSEVIFYEAVSAGCNRTVAHIGGSAVWDLSFPAHDCVNENNPNHVSTFWGPRCSVAWSSLVGSRFCPYMVNLQNVFFLHCLLKRCCVCRLSPMEYHEREEILKLRAVALKKVTDCVIVLHWNGRYDCFYPERLILKRHCSSILHGLNCSWSCINLLRISWAQTPC